MPDGIERKIVVAQPCPAAPDGPGSVHGHDIAIAKSSKGKVGTFLFLQASAIFLCMCLIRYVIYLVNLSLYQSVSPFGNHNF